MNFTQVQFVQFKKSFIYLFIYLFILSILFEKKELHRIKKHLHFTFMSKNVKNLKEILDWVCIKHDRTFSKRKEIDDFAIISIYLTMNIIIKKKKKKKKKREEKSIY